MAPISRFPITRTHFRFALVTLQIAMYVILAVGPKLELAVDLVALFVFVAAAIAIASLGRMRPGSALIWSIVFAAMAIALPESFAQSIDRPSGLDNLMLGIGLILGMTVLLFVSHAFVVAGEVDRRWIASYPTYVDTAWTLAAQTLLLILGLATLWGIYGLALWISDKAKLNGAKTDLEFLRWAFFPAVSLMVLAVFELSERRPALTGAVRTALTTLLSWLLPLAVLWGVFALAKVALRDPRQLWLDPNALAVLPIAAVGLILVINAQFQGGGSQADRFRLLVISRLAAIGLLFIVVLLYALHLATRYIDYRWTPGLVQGAAVLAVLGCYGVGYAETAISSGKAMRRLPVINVVAALLGIALTIAAATPLCSPTRLAVAYQIARLQSGEIAPDKFDYELLAFYAAPYGRPALERLIEKRDGPTADDVARRAQEALHADPKRRR